MRRFILFLLMVAGLATSPAWGQTFSVDAASPEVFFGLSQAGSLYIPAAAFGPVGLPVLPPAVINLGMNGEVDALSFGRAPNTFNTNAAVVFSLDRGSGGLAGTASGNEFSYASGSEQSSDIFYSAFNSTNALFADGDGTVPPGNVTPSAFPLGAGEAPTYPFPPMVPPVGGADLDALDLRANLFGLGSPTGRLFFSVDPFSAMPFSGGDVWVDPTGIGNPPNLYANEIQLGIAGGPPSPLPPPGSNDVDALVVYDNGDNNFQPGLDIVLFSLAPGSAYLGQMDSLMGLAIEPGDILMDALGSQAFLGTPVGTGPAILHAAESLGLRTVRAGFQSGDNLNALDVVPEPASLALVTVAAPWILFRRFRTRRHRHGR